MQERSLKVTDVSKKFKEGIALEHISFQASGGSITGFVGHNGSGKTVLFKCICGFYAVTEGEILIGGKAVGIGEDMPILIMDEPMNGLDRQGVLEVRELLLAEKEKGKIILLASHNSEDIEYLCDAIYKLENGRMIS